GDSSPRFCIVYPPQAPIAPSGREYTRSIRDPTPAVAWHRIYLKSKDDLVAMATCLLADTASPVFDHLVSRRLERADA
ncbi:MAG: hypothetical protein ACYSUF_11180, partial [Planctomycetota bacterium]